ncbi:uncharacterized protein [Mytilus edulis]|uniref:uncharacterized protein n=1 Tax=Mytilus edulis TaxID=6550 RepID=UPI0039F06DA9
MIAIKENKRHNLVSQLGLILDQENVIRCVGRLGAAQLSEGAKTPILLPKKNKVTKLLIESMHRKNFHVGVSQTLSAMRQTYWIPQGRSEVKRVLRKCIICKRCEGGPYKMPLMPPLPKKRVNESAPFTYTGVDYFGPIFVKSDTGSKKVWVCLYTCLVVRAIHMELMQDMSAEEFLLGFRRFIARWGIPKQIISDNGSQFKLASNTLEEAWNGVTVNSAVQTYMTNEGIQWQFIVELAPWMGGFYERLIGFPDHNEEDSTDPEYLPQISSAKKLLLTWKKGQKHLDMFWKTWRDEYLLSLHERTANKLRSGRIQSKTPAKTLNRALNMLYPIECEELDEGLKKSDTEKDTELINDNISTTRDRTQRQAARTAMKKIQEQLES